MSNVASSPLAGPTRLLVSLVVVLLLLNAALVGWLWLAPGHTPTPPVAPASGAAFLADTLQLSAAQRARYDSLQDHYSRQVRPLTQSCRQSCQQYFSLFDSTLTDEQLAARARKALASKVAVDVLTVRHLQQVSALCGPQQRNLLRQLLGQGPDASCAAPGTDAIYATPLPSLKK